MQNLEAPAPHRIPLRWKLLVAFLVLGGIGCLLAWAVLLTSFCSHPRLPEPATQNALTYSCHGRVVSISPQESALRYGLLPSGFFLVFLSLVAGVRALVVAGILRFNLSVKVTDTSTRHDPP